MHEELTNDEEHWFSYIFHLHTVVASYSYVRTRGWNQQDEHHIEVLLADHGFMSEMEATKWHKLYHDSAQERIQKEFQ